MKATITTLAVVMLGFSTIASADIVNCESTGHDRNYCYADTSGGVTMVHQLSHAGCWQGDSWGYDRHGIWVANGCRAEFRTGSYSSERSSSYDYHRNNDDGNVGSKGAGKAIGAALAIGLIAAAAANADKNDDRNDNYYGQGHYGRSAYTCESTDNRQHYCSIPGRFHHVEIKRQLSRSNCSYNQSWGYDRRGIWVDNGCRAEFWVD